MPANPWELRADVRPLDAAAQRWTEIAELMTRRGDDLVEAARRATEGWDAAAAESYDHHRRQVLANLDRFTALATQIAGSLRAVSEVLTSSQKELDQNWTKVAMVPHEVVGESRQLVFKPSEDDDRSKVTQAQTETQEIRRRLTLALDQESTRLRGARAEFALVRTELQVLAGTELPDFTTVGEVSGVGTVPPHSTSVPGSAQGGVGVHGLAPVAPIAVDMPDLQGISGLTPGAAAAAAAAAAGMAARRGARTSAPATPPLGGMGAGAMAARGGSMSRGTAGGRAGSRLSAPRLDGATDEDAAARAAREKDAAREAKRAALEEKRAERAARKAEREAERQAGRDPGREREAGRGAGREQGAERGRDKARRARDEDERGPEGEDPTAEAAAQDADGTDGARTADAPDERPPAIVMVHEPTPGRPGEGPHR